MFHLISCGGTRIISLDEPPIGESVEIYMISGEKREGVLLKKEGSDLTLIDSSTNKPEKIDIKNIRTIKYSDKVYDLEGKIISENDISEAKGITKTIGYGLGGFVLGTAVGFGVGVLISSQEEIALIYPMGILGLAGGIYFGIKGSGMDREDAIDEIRRERYRETQVELMKQLEQEKKKLEEQQVEREKMMQELKKKKKD